MHAMLREFDNEFGDQFRRRVAANNEPELPANRLARPLRARSRHSVNVLADCEVTIQRRLTVAIERL
jgi:hypothetical protein